jgi:tetratricopeptide (TPR) repeat protein
MITEELPIFEGFPDDFFTAHAEIGRAERLVKTAGTETDPEKKKSCYDEALGIFLQQDYLPGIADVYIKLAILHKNEIKDPRQVVSYYTKAIEICEKQTEQGDKNALPPLADSYYGLATTQHSAGQHEEAEYNYTKARTLYCELVSADGDNRADYLKSLGFLYFNRARLQKFSFSNYPLAEDNYKEAVECFKECDNAKQGRYLKTMAELYADLADLQNYKLYKYREAASCYKEAISIYEQLKPQGHTQYLRNVVDLYSKYALLQENHFSDYINAEINYTYCLDCCEKLVAAGELSFQYGVATRSYLLAEIQHWKMKKGDDAEINYTKSIDSFTLLLQRNKKTEYLYDLAVALSNRGKLKKTAGKKKEALSDFKEACKYCEEAIVEMENIPETFERWEYEALIFLCMANLYLDLGKYVKSIGYYKESLGKFILLAREKPSLEKNIFTIYNCLCYLCKLGNKGAQAFGFAKRAYLLAAKGDLNLSMSDFMDCTLATLRLNIEGFEFGVDLDVDLSADIDVGSLLDIDWAFLSDISFPEVSDFGAGILDSIFNTD